GIDELCLPLVAGRGHHSWATAKGMAKKNIIIIGATSGIGRALAEVFAAEGHKVGVTGRREALLRDMATARPASYHTAAFDVTDTATSLTHLQALAAAMGGVDTIVISAGGGDTNETLDF